MWRIRLFSCEKILSFCAYLEVSSHWCVINGVVQSVTSRFYRYFHGRRRRHIVTTPAYWIHGSASAAA